MPNLKYWRGFARQKCLLTNEYKVLRDFTMQRVMLPVSLQHDEIHRVDVFLVCGMMHP